MSQAKRRHGDHANSLFPFLAVLLCTVGALILLLVMIVNQSQASVKQAIDQRAEKAEELRAQVEMVRESFREDREKIQLEIEKKRMTLQSLEQQTADLSKELEQLSKTSELIDKDLTSDDSVEKVEAALTDMQKQLQEAASRLKNKLDNPTKSKPVFAIIPYEGGNGTHRRPIYLECRADGILIQPEGVFIGLKDLRPPYGPGNPLDAALRAARTYYAPEGAALNASAYPLLVVRSSGIKTYALARMAMSGWDDQFGYELIEDDMELAFPPSEGRLGKELERTLATARDRQAALVMAMPGRYRQAMEELSEDKLDMGDEPGSWSESAGDAGSGEGAGFGFGSGSGGSGNGTGSSAAQLASKNNASGFPSGGGVAGGVAGGRGGFAFAPDGASGGMPGSGGAGPNGTSAMNSRGGGSGIYGFATGGDAQDTSSAGDYSAAGNGKGSAPGGQGTYPGSMSGANPSGAKQFGQQNGQPGGPGSFAEGAFGGNQYTRGGEAGAGGELTAGEGGGQQSSRTSSAANGQGNSPRGTGGRPGNFRDAMNAARSKQDGSENAQGSVAGSAVDTGTGGSSMVAANSDGFGSMGSTGIESDPNGGGTPMMGMNVKKGDKKQNAESVAKRKGRNWAWTAGPSRQTAVVRHIRVQCYEDRWVVMPDAGTRDKAQTVMLDVSLQTSAEQLAKIVADRIDRWGYALSDGYWKPILQVEVAPRSDFRYTQLVKLLDGSGLEVQRVQAGR